MLERIVYGQQDLLAAINDGIRAVTLCAGIYEIPIAPGTSFDRLGPVAVSVKGTKAEADASGMEFIDIYPEYRSGYAVDSREMLYTVAAAASGSYGGSYFGSGLYGGSFTGFGSYFGSGLYGGSFTGSFSWHGIVGGSFISGSYAAGSFWSSANASFPFFGSPGSHGISGSLAASSGCVMPDVILGYGIDLI